MGRGLSDIQKAILSFAARNHGQAYQGEILQELYGWDRDTSRPEARFLFKAHHFSRVEVGESEYNVARASVSRAIRRLEERGLG